MSKPEIANSRPAGLGERARSRLRLDRRREQTRVALIEKAETMFAQEGCDAVSLRQIGTAVGSANTTVVAYYFGDKKGLISAIFHHRLPRMEARRAELLAIATQEARGYELQALVHAHWQPMFELVDKRGYHSFAGFVLSVGSSSWASTILEAGSVNERNFPVSTEIRRRIIECFPGMSRYFNQRFIMNGVMISAALKQIDYEHHDDPVRARQMFEDALRMATAAFAAPTGD